MILILSFILLIVLLFFIFNRVSTFKTIPTIQEQEIKNNDFLNAYNKLKEKQNIQNENKVPLTWNPNNTLESMELKPCLSDRLTCYTAPMWWYPEKKYNENNFRSVYYGDYYDPIYNYLGNVQDMFWDFKSVKDTYSII